jgi:hypothetical protein
MDMSYYCTMIIKATNIHEWAFPLPIILTVHLTLTIFSAFLNWFLSEDSSLMSKVSTLGNDFPMH